MCTQNKLARFKDAECVNASAVCTTAVNAMAQDTHTHTHTHTEREHNWQPAATDVYALLASKLP